MSNARPHPFPQATEGDSVTFRAGRLKQTATVLHVATGHGWPCYLVAGNIWIGHEHLTAAPHKESKA